MLHPEMGEPTTPQKACLPKAMLAGCNSDPVVSGHVRWGQGRSSWERGVLKVQRRKKKEPVKLFFFWSPASWCFIKRWVNPPYPKKKCCLPVHYITNSGCACGVQNQSSCEWACCPTLTGCPQLSTWHFKHFLRSKNNSENTFLGQLFKDNPNLTHLEGYTQSGHSLPCKWLPRGNTLAVPFSALMLRNRTPVVTKHT